ncbi:ADP-ribosylation factor GTPase-activating protein GCS1 [Acrodontium crateriforme]|uniref:ADP-ribosylation factor GTPase-activating protein GCS1 n=1 Tax=Acrodontium crateriforme TaxID=150365 RepID=A0AAQ3M861_9PEZI|nr:ADP-ribosylation factor GTPase-activating protein GCS1 [Acrodontium crateriforme]
MSKMWEVDPETRSKLQEIQKSNENNRCVDCGAPSPQWISPKFGIFFCLACSGIHRSLGVHISFVRSATMDALKTNEVGRMELGGNKPWKDFFNNHDTNTLSGRDFESCTISERYDSEAGEEWKERLSAKVEDREFDPAAVFKPAPKKQVAPSSIAGNSGRNTPLDRVASPPQRGISPSQKAQNEAYFARMGSANANRPDDLAPNQGGKYSGFGSDPMPSNNHSDFQSDPMAALTKGFGWLSSTVTKQAASVNKAYIQPGMKSIQDGEFAAQARARALQLGSTVQAGVQQGTRGLNDQFSKFVDPDHIPGSNAPTSGRRGPRAEPEKKDFWDSFGQDPAGPSKDKKDFWDSFAAAGDSVQAKAKPSSIGTAAMKPSAGSAATGKKDDGEWGDW